ncbi:hypothetical protein KDK77_00920 [bacterium]|nr:hypothetical protein [bacterium]MCP5462042.1 hypothetical protein [bacterium]
MKKQCLNVWILFISSICMYSCSEQKPYRMYEGTQLPETEFAHIVTYGSGASYQKGTVRAQITSIDNIDVPKSNIEFELLPGLHSLDVGFYAKETSVLQYMHFDLDYSDIQHYIHYSKEDDTIQFFAQSGHTYLVVIRFSNDSPTNFTAGHYFFADVIDITDTDY